MLMYAFKALIVANQHDVKFGAELAELAELDGLLRKGFQVPWCFGTDSQICSTSRNRCK